MGTLATTSSLFSNVGVSLSLLFSVVGDATTDFTLSVGEVMDLFLNLSLLDVLVLGKGGLLISGFFDVSCVIPVMAMLIGRVWRGVDRCRNVTELFIELELC